MAVPAQVKKQMEEIEQYEKALAEQVVADQTVQTEIPEQTAVTTETVPETKAATPTPEVVETPTNVVELHPEADAKEEETYKQRYKTLQGMYATQWPQMIAQNKELQATVQQLQKDLVALSAATKSETSQAKLVSDEEVESFGADLIDVQRRIAREVSAGFQAQLEELKAENKQLQAMIGQTGSQVANLSFEQKLQIAVPDFEALNDNPKWVAWLDEIDPILRGPRRTVAQQAYERGDVAAVKDYADMFKATQRPVAAAATSADEELRQQVAPSRSTNASPTQTQERVYTEAEMSKLFDKVGALYRQGKNEEASKLDAELTNAYTSGRVR